MHGTQKLNVYRPWPLVSLPVENFSFWNQTKVARTGTRASKYRKRKCCLILLLHGDPASWPCLPACPIWGALQVLRPALSWIWGPFKHLSFIFQQDFFSFFLFKNFTQACNVFLVKSTLHSLLSNFFPSPPSNIPYQFHVFFLNPLSPISYVSLE